MRDSVSNWEISPSSEEDDEKMSTAQEKGNTQAGGGARE